MTPDFTILITCFGAPFQAEGKIGDTEWSYRERHDRWGMSIGDEEFSGSSKDEHSHLSDLNRIFSLVAKYVMDAAVKRDDAYYDAAYHGR